MCGKVCRLRLIFHIHHSTNIHNRQAYSYRRTGTARVQTDSAISDRYFSRPIGFFVWEFTVEAAWGLESLCYVGKSRFFNKLFCAYIALFKYFYTKVL